jgi:hypothetical protein
MAGVTIDIPNLGNIEAKNAATEATLKEILKALQRIQRDVGGIGKDMEGGAGGAGAGDGSDKAEDKKKQLAQRLGTAYGLLFAGTKAVIQGFGNVAMASVDLIDSLAGVGDSLTSAASSLRHIPVVGGFLAGVFGAVAGAAESVAKSFNDAASSGATFGGSINEFSRSASAAGMTMAEFGSLIKSSGEGMLGFGTTVEAGAKRFAEVSRTLRTTSSDLYALGFSTQDINKGLATYGNMLRMQGMQGRQSNAQLVAGAQKYLKELDALAKITGVERSAKEAEMMATLKDAQFQGAMANQTKEVRDSFLSTLGGLAGGMQGPLGNFAKDILATGTATGEENQKLMAMMPQSAKMLQDLRAKMQRGEAVTEEERNRLNNLMAQEGAKAAKQYGGTFAAAPEYAQTMNALTLAQSMQKDAVTKATAEQKKAKEQTDKQNEAIQKSKQTLAEFSNSFQMALVNSGLLQGLMVTFQALANFVGTVLVPIFQMLAPVLTYFVESLSTILTPAFNFLGETVRDYVMPAFFAVTDFIEDNMVPILVGAMAALAPALWAYIAAKKAATVETYKEIAAKLAALGPFALVAVAVTAVVAIFQALYRNGFTLSTTIEALKDNFGRLWLTLQDWMDGLLSMLPRALGGISDEEAKIRKLKRDAERKELDDKEKLRDTERQAKKKERGIDDSFAKKREERDKKFYADKTARDTKASEPAGLDMSSPEATAVSFFTQQKSPLVKKDSAQQQSPAAPATPPATDETDAESAKLARLAAARASSQTQSPAAPATPPAAPATPPATDRTEGTYPLPEAQMNRLAGAPSTYPLPEAQMNRLAGAPSTYPLPEAQMNRLAGAPSQTQSLLAKAEAARKELENKKEEDEKRAVQTNYKAEVEAGGGATKAANPELVEISKSMAELVKINRANARIMEKQLGVQESLSGDVWAYPAA